MKARKKSTVCTMAMPGGTRTTAASSGACRPMSTSSRSTGCSAPSARDSTDGPHLGATAAAAHGNGRDGLQRFFRRERRLRRMGGRRTAGVRVHGRELAEAAHEAAVDPVFPAPDPVALRAEPAARGNGMAVARADQRQPAALRVVGLERLAEHAAPQVLAQRRALAHREHPRLFQRVVDHGGNVAGRENARVGQGLQVVVDLDKAARVQCQTGLCQPGRAAGLRDPDDFVRVQRRPLGRLQTPGGHFNDFGSAVHRHAAGPQHLLEAAAHACVVGGQDFGTGGEQVKVQLGRVAALCAQFGPQAVLHGQGQFHAPRAAAHHGDGGAPRVAAHPLQQRQPALVELVDGFDRHRVFGGARHLLHLRRRADVDRQAVVGHGRPVAAQHLAGRAVDADHFVAVQPRTGKRAKPTQIDVHVVVAVMARDVAGQHARIGRVGVGADDGQAHAGQWRHAEAPQHPHMAVAAADQDDVAQYRLFRGLHSRFQKLLNQAPQGGTFGPG